MRLMVFVLTAGDDLCHDLTYVMTCVMTCVLTAADDLCCEPQATSTPVGAVNTPANSPPHDRNTPCSKSSQLCGQTGFYPYHDSAGHGVLP